MYCLSGFVVVYERSSAECTIMHVITGICLVLVMGEIKFLRKFRCFFFLCFFSFLLLLWRDRASNATRGKITQRNAFIT